MLTQRLCFVFVSLLIGAEAISSADFLAEKSDADQIGVVPKETSDKRYSRALSDRGIPPGPPTSFYQYFWGHYPQMRARGILPFIDETLQRYGQEGVPVHISLGMKDLYVISDPEDAHQILSGPHREKIAKGFSSQFLRDYFVGEGLGFLETKGEGWKDLHDAMFHFFNESIIRTKYFTSMREHARYLAESLAKRNNDTIDLEREMTIHTMKVVAKSMLNFTLDDKRASALADHFATALNFIHYRMTNFPFYVPLFVPTEGNSNFKRAKREIESFIQSAIDNDETLNHDDEKPEALISYLRKATKSPQPIELDYADAETIQISSARFVAQLNNIFMAGHDTTKHLLTAILYQLARNPKVKAKLVAELNEQFGGTDNGLVEPRQLSPKNLPYLDAVVQETLRINSSVPAVARDVLQGFTLRGYTIPKGAVVMISFDALHKNSDEWADPLEFNPERFQSNFNDHKRRHRNSLMPFSTGQRSCIGRFFALQEVKTTIVELILAGIDFEIVPETKWEPTMACTMRLKNGLLMRVKKGYPLGS